MSFMEIAGMLCFLETGEDSIYCWLTKVINEAILVALRELSKTTKLLLLESLLQETSKCLQVPQIAHNNIKVHRTSMIEVPRSCS